MKPAALILRAPGTNCDQETAYAFELAGARAESWHVNRILERPAICRDFQILCLPGGFSYGDDLGAGCILGSQIRTHLAEVLREFRDAGKLVLGICNGFQILMRSGLLLPDDPVQGPPATLTLNASGKFEDRWVELRTQGDRCVFLRGIERMYLPVAHAEGRFVARDAATLAALDSAGQLALRYAPSANGQAGTAGGSSMSDQPLAYPVNPNGAQRNVAGACDPSGRVFGLMPHPERHIDRTHHPRWTRGEGSAAGEGLQVFRNAVGYFAA